MDNNRKSPIKKIFGKSGAFNAFLSKYGIPIALAGCALVVGVTWYLSYGEYKGKGTPADTPAPQESIQPIDNDLSENLNDVTKAPETTPRPIQKSSLVLPSKPAPEPAVESAAAPVLLKPASGKIVKNYSMDELIYSKTLNQWGTHSGVDIALEEGENIIAATDGTVEKAYEDTLMGNCVLIKHDEKTYLLYCGLLSLEKLTAGTNFKQGQVIGQGGGVIPCESSDGLHLHFELIENNKPKDPSIYWK